MATGIDTSLLVAAEVTSHPDNKLFAQRFRNLKLSKLARCFGNQFNANAARNPCLAANREDL
jgi:hypothetical protein